MTRALGPAAAIVTAAVVLAACSGSARHPAPPNGDAVSQRPETAVASSAGTARQGAGGTVWLALGGGARVVVPRTWRRVRYHGVPAPEVFPILFLTDGRLGGRCVSGPASDACSGPAWFAPHWRTPAGGVLLDWLDVSFPGDATARHFLPYVHAPVITLAHRPAKIVRAAARSCPPGAAFEIDAYVQRARAGYPGNRLDMTACFGAHAPAGTRRAVMRMVRSLRFHRQHH